MVTIQGYQFEVAPDPAVASASIPDEWKQTLQQTRIENIRNNMAARIKKLMNGSEQLTDEQLSQVKADLEKYASEYQFGVRARGAGGPRVVDPVEREVIRLAKEDISAAYFAKHGERLKGEQLSAVVDKLLEARREDYVKRARRNIADRQRAGDEVLAQAGI